MKLPIAQKINIGLLAVIMAVALCALPFFTIKKDRIYIYTSSPVLDSREEGFINELKQLGYEIKVNHKELPQEEDIGIWISPKDGLDRINQSVGRYNFIYSENYNPYDWQSIQSDIIMLTPYRDIYEHYARSNIKAAMFMLGVNMSDFYMHENNFQKDYKKYPVIYYGDYEAETPLGKRLQYTRGVKFIGRFWPRNQQLLSEKEGKAKERGEYLSRADITVIYKAPESSASKFINSEIMESAASGTLVISSSNARVKAIYGDSIVSYDNIEEIKGLVDYYLQNPEITKRKIIDTQRITQNHLSSKASAERFKSILDWLQENGTKK